MSNPRQACGAQARRIALLLKWLGYSAIAHVSVARYASKETLRTLANDLKAAERHLKEALRIISWQHLDEIEVRLKDKEGDAHD